MIIVRSLFSIVEGLHIELIQNIDLCGTTGNASGFSISIQKFLRCMLLLCICTWQISTHSYNNPATFLDLRMMHPPEHAIQSSQFRMYRENKVFVGNHCCPAWRYWQAVHVCSLLSTSWSHTQASTMLQAGSPVAIVMMKRLYITSWSY